MIHETSGDILLSSAQMIAHGVAPNDNFHSGLALSLREQWPAMYNDFRHYCHQSHPQPGEVWVWSGVGGVRIACLMTQEAAYDHGAKPGRAKLENVNHCLKALRQVIQSEKITSLALPRLATGVGGLEWDLVQPLIKAHLGDLKIPIEVYTTYHKGVKAAAPQKQHA